MQMIRVFFAIDLPEPIQDNLCHVIEQFHENKNDLHCHWIEPHHFHITLQFLKEMRADDIVKMIQNVRQQLQEIKPFEIELNHLELFPNSRRPRYISLIPTPNEILNQVAKCIGEGILATDYPIETRAYRPHLTLGRLYEIPSENLFFNIELSMGIKFLVNEIIFYQSNPHEQRRCYIPLERIELRAR